MFPPDAFQGDVAASGKVFGFLLQLKWPDMGGLTLSDLFKPVEEVPSLLILAVSGAQVAGDAAPPAYFVEAERREVSLAVAPVGTSGFPLRLAPPGAAHGAVPGNGMLMVTAHPNLGAAPDVFVSPSIEAPDEVITCGTTTETFGNPQCSQHFVVQNLILTVSYNRPLVGHWRAIHEAVAAYLTTKQTRQ